MAGKGGVREGAGRKKKAVKFERPINGAERKIVDHLPMIVDRALELVDGVTVLEHDSRGQERIYTRPPDRDMIKYLMDRIMGKPTERHEHTGEDGGPIVVEGFDYNAAIANITPRPGDNSPASGED